MKPGITVSGFGEVKASPDIATLHLGAEAAAPTASAARALVAETASNLIASLKANGIAEADITTEAVSVQAQYEYPSAGGPRLTGYQAANGLLVTLRDLEAAGRTIDAALEAAGDAGRLRGLQFGFADRAPLLERARRLAARDARLRAEAFARGAGVKVGKVLTVVEGGSASSPQPMLKASRAALTFAQDTTIEAGETSVTASVIVRFALR